MMPILYGPEPSDQLTNDTISRSRCHRLWLRLVQLQHSGDEMGNTDCQDIWGHFIISPGGNYTLGQELSVCFLLPGVELAAASSVKMVVRKKYKLAKVANNFDCTGSSKLIPRQQQTEPRLSKCCEQCKQHSCKILQDRGK